MSSLFGGNLEAIQKSARASQDLGKASVDADLKDDVARQLQLDNSLSRVAIAQIHPGAAQLEGNFRQIKAAIDKAESLDAHLLVFPELAIPGYLALDHFENPRFIAQNEEVLQRIVRETAGMEVVVVVGYARQDPKGGKPFNSAAVIHDGQLLGYTDKTLLPDYDIFWENRYFQSASARKPIQVGDVSLGIQICEDSWDERYPIKVSDELVKQGADLLVNLSASPFHLGKEKIRHELLAEKSGRLGTPFIYANMVGVQDGYEGEVVFDGRSMIFSASGELLSESSGFSEDLTLVDLHSARAISLPNWAPEEELHEALVLGIREYFARNGFKRAYIGISGGIDSALTAALAVEALGAENVVGVTMPSHITSDETLTDAVKLCAALSIRLDTRSIGSQYQAWISEAEKAHDSLESITKQNVQARLRGMILMEYTNEDREGLVLSTGNKTETALGYCTLYGDMCGGLAVLGDVSKHQVYELSRYVNRRAGREVIPVSTIDRAPTAELEDDQKDSDNLPADYPILSPLVDRLVEDGSPVEELVAELAEQGVENAQEIVTRTARMIHIAEYKRRQMAPGIKVTAKSFGSGRRMPMGGKAFTGQALNI